MPSKPSMPFDRSGGVVGGETSRRHQEAASAGVTPRCELVPWPCLVQLRQERRRCRRQCSARKRPRLRSSPRTRRNLASASPRHAAKLLAASVQGQMLCTGRGSRPRRCLPTRRRHPRWSIDHGYTDYYDEDGYVAQQPGSTMSLGSPSDRDSHWSEGSALPVPAPPSQERTSPQSWRDTRDHGYTDFYDEASSCARRSGQGRSAGHLLWASFAPGAPPGCFQRCLYSVV